jgi:heat shock protein HslJ
MRNQIFLATLMVIALIATACGTQAAAPTNPLAQPKEQPVSKSTLDGTSWTLTTLNGQPTLKDTTVTLNFAAGKAAGTDGCNRYTGAYTADDTSIKFSGQMASTMMACPEPIMKQASAYQQALGQAATYKVEGTQLALSDAHGKELASFSAQNSDLAGTSWIVTGYNNGKQAVVSTMAGTDLTANFGVDGNLTGNSGCNTYSAVYQTDGHKISIGPAAATMMACEQAVRDQETQYLAALSTAATYRIAGSKWELRTADGALAVTLSKVGR